MTPASNNPQTFESMSELVYALEGVEIVSSKPANMGAAALWYAEKWGWPVFPCRPRGKQPLTERGFKDASLDPAQIRDWFTRWPDANVATPTGTAGCGFDIVDVDGTPGHESLVELQAAGHLPPVLATVFTPGDPVKDRAPGRHLYIQAQGQRNATALMPGIDVRADAGYVLLPPSIALHGVSYAWLAKPAGLT